MATYTSQNLVHSLAFMQNVMNAYAVVPTAALAATPKVHLSTDPNFNPQPTNVSADFTGKEAAYTGYTAGGATVGPLGGGQSSPTCRVMLGTVTFQVTTSGPSNVVYGYWVDNAAGLIAAERFPAGLSFPLQNAGDFLELILELPMQALQATI